MCGRFVQFAGVFEYLEALKPQQELFGGYDNIPIGKYNVAPATLVKIFCSTERGISIEASRWGWKPAWAKDNRPPMINARSETVADSKYFRPIWPHRCVVPANGWYEWTGEPGKKQPYYIHLKTEEPMFFAAIGEFSGHVEHDGFVVITADAQGGMVDIHDRRPVVLPPALAREWLDPSTTSKRAKEILEEASQQSEHFTWYKVDRAVGNARNQGERLIKPQNKS
ncbi:SOS response-associated peptidase [Saezia sanguinis]|uniref:SOS response-associated peptidase n=1 Tax=Saezia sanguinis TaxID=1965230 RepID=UPI00306A639C